MVDFKIKSKKNMNRNGKKTKNVIRNKRKDEKDLVKG